MSREVIERRRACADPAPGDFIGAHCRVCEAILSTDELGRSCFGIDLATGEPSLDSLRRRLARAATQALPAVRSGHFDAADAQVLAVDRDIQASVMLGAMYTAELQRAVSAGERESRREFVTLLHDRALRWRLSAYPEPHTAYEADDYASGREADRAQLAALLDG